MAIEIKSEEDFDRLVSTGPTLILFTAPAWCQPCRQFEPHWAKAQDSELLDHITFAKIDMGETVEDTANHWASKRFNILGVPQLKLFNFAEDAEPVNISSRAIVPLIRELTK